MTDTKASLGGCAASSTYPHRLSEQQRKKLAEAARRLAMECATGTAPPMINDLRHAGGDEHCALGWVEVYAGVDNMYLSNLDEETIVADANNFETPERITSYEDRWAQPPARNHAARQSRLVFPLFALADALEDAAEPPKSIP